LSENLVGNFLSKNAKFGGAKTHTLGKFRGKIEILSSHNFRFRKRAAVSKNSVGKFQRFSVSLVKEFS